MSSVVRRVGGLGLSGWVPIFVIKKGVVSIIGACFQNRVYRLFPFFHTLSNVALLHHLCYTIFSTFYLPLREILVLSNLISSVVNSVKKILDIGALCNINIYCEHITIGVRITSKRALFSLSFWIQCV